jgi:ribosomal protein L16 Arg81 hydroxylase
MSSLSTNKANPAPQMAPCLKVEEVPAADLTHKYFVEHYFNPRVPALLKGACGNWTFMQKWTLDYLTGELGDFQCTIARDSRPALSKEKCSLRQYYRDYSHLSTMTFVQFDAAKDALPKFLQDIPLPNPFLTRNDIDTYFFFHANEGGGGLPHCHMDAFNLLQYGTKHWVLYDADPELNPQGWETLKRCHEVYGAGTFSHDWFVEGPQQVRREGITLYECEQHAGDIVYIPEHFSHAILNRAQNQGMVIITKRPSKVYKKEVGSGFSPNQAHVKAR